MYIISHLYYNKTHTPICVLIVNTLQQGWHLENCWQCKALRNLLNLLVACRNLQST